MPIGKFARTVALIIRPFSIERELNIRVKVDTANFDKEPLDCASFFIANHKNLLREFSAENKLAVCDYKVLFNFPVWGCSDLATITMEFFFRGKYFDKEMISKLQLSNNTTLIGGHKVSVELDITYRSECTKRALANIRLHFHNKRKDDIS